MALHPDIVASVNIPDAYPAVNRLRRSRKHTPKIVMTVHGIEAYLYDDIALSGSHLTVLYVPIGLHVNWHKLSEVFLTTESFMHHME